MIEIILVIVGLLAGILIGFLYGKSKNGHAEEVAAQVASFQKIIDEQNLELGKERAENKSHIQLSATMQTKLDAAEERLAKQRAEFEEMKKTLGLEFKQLADRIFEEKTDRLKKDNKEGLDALLAPLKERIKEFSDKVENTHKKDIQERTGLKSEIDRLIKLNQQLSTDAQSLTTALRGENKTQGNWGELILQKVLQSSGLTEGNEYRVQHAVTNEEGRRLQPDVVVNLPDERHIIIDSKVSLVAYERLVNADSEEDRKQHLRDHLLSIKTHVKQLSEKNYQQSQNLASPDFVLLFVPIESSFATAIQADAELFNFAWSRKIVIVTPSTLLATLRTIQSVWQYEKQNRNVEEIARLAGNLYDKLAGFIGDLEKVGDRINAAAKTHQEAVSKLHTGKNNVIRIAERTKSLGIESKKRIPDDLVAKSKENELDSGQ
ncbi:MAG: DNA recombination protein RmuC [Flavobacteriales bacterium]|nr:DNA recombination protein RmuC [Flavobacteriales bacterium]